MISPDLTQMYGLVRTRGLPANGGINFTHHAKVDVSQLARPQLEKVARVGVTVVVPLL